MGGSGADGTRPRRRISEEQKYGATLGRLDIPTADGRFVTQLFSGNSVYRLTYVGEAEARAVAARNQPQPVHSWEMPRALPGPSEHTGPPATEPDRPFDGQGYAVYPDDDEDEDEDIDPADLPRF